MIPVRLAIRNFMCYRDNVPPINFDGIHVACLSGDNGNGKSALIDAMTWALWGQTRARSDDELVHSTQTEAEVEFDFRVGQQLYRIIRKHSRPKKQGRSGQTLLEFQIATGDTFKSISGDGIIQTQQKIKDVLHMDYDTFINSAYLRQGHADEFTQQPPAKRKEVLTSILDFSLYDRLEAQARDIAKQQESEKARLESAIAEISNELCQAPAYQAELVQAQGELAGIEGVATQKEAGLNSLRQERQSLEQKKSQFEQLQTNLTDVKKQLELWNEQAGRHRARINECEELIARRTAIEEGYLHLTEAKKLNDELDQKFRKIAGLDQRRHRLEMAIEQARQALLREHAVAQNKIGDLEARSQALPARQEQLQQAHALWQQLAARAESLQKRKEAAQELQEHIGVLISSGSQLEKQINELKEKLDLLSTHADARCPLCESELGTEGLKLIHAKYTAELQSKSDSLKANQVELSHKRAELQLLNKEVAQSESQLDQARITAQGKISVLRKEIAEAEEAAKQLGPERDRLAKIEQQIVSRSFAANEQSALTALETELASLSYSAEQHEQVRQQLGGLEKYEQLKRKLEEFDRLIGTEREALAKAEETAAKLQQGLEADNQKIQALNAEMSRLPVLLRDLASAESQFKEITAKRSQAQELVGSVKSKLARCAALEESKKEKTKQLDEAAKQEDIYEDLAEAFGKRGIQALLIEMVLPEIENEANQLLGRMTDNRMHVKFETQRETKKGSVQETLDITISDELGTRNYEMFSGGETFRINFAIRIALSKLLAKRAGAPLPTLIIDEGFGTQDVTGIEKLKEAINSIQDDFEKIIVITHIEELRDAFPTRIDVVKTADGSTISVS